MLTSLQILRALAAWAVVFTHIQQSFYMGGNSNQFWLFFGNYGAFGVDIFFVLSGFVMALVSKKYIGKGFSFGLNRVFRLIPVYWFYTFLLVICILIFPTGTYLTLWTDLSLIKSFLFIPHANPNDYGNYPLLYVGWTLIYEMFFYLIFTFILIMRLPNPSIFCAFTMIILALIFRSHEFLGHSSLLLVEFSIGIFLFMFVENTKSKKPLIKSSVLIFLFLVALFSSYFILESLLLTKMSLAGLTVYLFIIMENKLDPSNGVISILKDLGDYSYSTYLNHIIIIGWFYWLFGGSNGGGIDIIAIISILITTFWVSKISYNQIESSAYILRFKGILIVLLKSFKEAKS